MTGKGWIVFFFVVVAVVLFVAASLGWFPADLRDDLEPVSMGLAFLGVALGFHLFMRGSELA